MQHLLAVAARERTINNKAPFYQDNGTGFTSNCPYCLVIVPGLHLRARAAFPKLESAVLHRDDEDEPGPADLLTRFFTPESVE